MWWTEKWIDENGNPGQETHHPHKAAPLCVPCNHSKDTSGFPFSYPKGCPCTPSFLSAADSKGTLATLYRLLSLPVGHLSIAFYFANSIFHSFIAAISKSLALAERRIPSQWGLYSCLWSFAENNRIGVWSQGGCQCHQCWHDYAGVFFQGPQGQCGVPRVPIRTYSMHGGAGALISIGLLKAIPFQQFEDCVTTTYSTGELSLYVRRSSTQFACIKERLKTYCVKAFSGTAQILRVFAHLQMHS